MHCPQMRLAAVLATVLAGATSTQPPKRQRTELLQEEFTAEELWILRFQLNDDEGELLNFQFTGDDENGSPATTVSDKSLSPPAVPQPESALKILIESLIANVTESTLTILERIRAQRPDDCITFSQLDRTKLQIGQFAVVPV